MKVSKVLYTSKSINELKKLFHAVSFDITTLHKSFESGQLLPSQVITKSHQRISDDKASWIMQIPIYHVLSEAQALDIELKELREKGKSFQDLLQKYPLFGIPFGVKDNIDVAGFPTTAGCPSFSRTPWETAPVVEQLKKAGAVLMGKQNLDQFGAGLAGLRTPYGIPENPFNAEYCPGGSSSGGGVSTSTHQVSFSIGTDTAGSGRIPACFNNIVGFKPTFGILSTRGLVPACRTLDCVSILALSCDDAWKVFTNCREYDPKDEFSRSFRLSPIHFSDKPLNFGIPKSGDLKFFGSSAGAKEAYLDGIELLKKTTGAVFTEIDFTPFFEAAKILYDGPWISERLSAITEFFDTRKDDLHPVTKGILERGKTFSGVDTFLGFRRLEKLKREAYEIWDEAKIDALVVPTASITPTIKEVMEVPVAINTVIGIYTSFVNLLDLCAVSVPNFILPSGMPTGISIIGRAFDDHFIYQVGRLFQSARNIKLGAKEFLLPRESMEKIPFHLTNEFIEIVVSGAYLKDLPLNKQLADMGGRFVRSLKTKPVYSLYDISTEDQKRSALVRNEDTGTPIRVEVWRIPRIKAGEFIERVRAPLVLGSVELEDGTSVKGFLCESYVVRKAKDVSSFGDWRAYLDSN